MCCLCYPKKDALVNDWVQQLLWTSLGYAALAIVCIVALIGLYTFFPGVRHRLLPLPRLRPGAWTGLDVLLTFFVLYSVTYFVLRFLFSLGTFHKLLGPVPDQETERTQFQEYLNRCTNIASPLILAATLMVIVTFLFLRTGSRPHHYGMSWARWPANLTLGIITFLLATPLVHAIHATMMQIFPPNDHALVHLGKQGIDDWEWALLAFQASVAAALLEELVFRGILLGWLRRAALQGHLTVCAMTIFAAIIQASTRGGAWSYIYPILFAVCLAAGYGYLLVRMARRFGLNDGELRAWNVAPSANLTESTSLLSDEEAKRRRQDLREQQERRARQWAQTNADLAIVGSAMLFAAVHSNNWPAPIPLMLLGLALGWLARRTQSLIAPITLHALFNLVAFLALYGTVSTAAPANGNAHTTPVRPSVAASITTSVPASQLPLRR
jgi:membrane protease YdiL (CAAX protease family)